MLLGRIDQFLALFTLGILVALAALIFEAGSVLVENAEIVVGILQIIFGLHPVARELGIASEALVFLEQLSGIAALAVVLAVPRLSAEVLPPLPTAAAPAATLSLIDQMPTSLRSVLCSLWPSGSRVGASAGS